MLEVLEALDVLEELEGLEGVEVNDEDHYQLEDVAGEDSRVDWDCILQPCCSRSIRRKVAGERQSIPSRAEGRGGGSSTGRAGGRTRTSRWRPAPGGSGRQSTGRGRGSCRGCGCTPHNLTLHSPVEQLELVGLHSPVISGLHSPAILEQVEHHSPVILVVEQEELRS